MKSHLYFNTVEHDNLIKVLQERSTLTDKGITFIVGNDQTTFVSYQELYKTSLKWLCYLQSKGIGSRDELVFQIEDIRTFVVIIWACILGGIIPVPVSIGHNDDHKRKFFNVWSVLHNPYLITSPEILEALVAFGRQQGYAELLDQITARAMDDGADVSSFGDGEIFNACGGDVALVQFSSGSTGAPKGVVLTHQNIITNLKAISHAAGYLPDDSMLSWMPLTHDMGLIGFHMNPLFTGMNQFLMATNLFVRRPVLWIEKASAYRVSILCSPNFGFWYLQKYGDIDGIANCDLSCVRLLYNGAEPISAALCHSFLTRLACYGLKSHTMCPVYGLAEATLAVTISDLAAEVIEINLRRRSVNFGEAVAIHNDGEGGDIVTFVNVGKPINDCQLRIANQQGVALEEDRIGYIQIKGDNVTSGYYNNPHATADAITRDGWLNTGDLGFIHHQCLYVTGRAKDIIFINGQNFYPHDLERVAEEVSGIELNKVVFAGCFNDSIHRDEIIGFVLHKGDLQSFCVLAQTLRKHINSRMGIVPDRVLPVKIIPKTTSGKIQRYKLLEDFLSGSFTAIEDELDRLMVQMAAEASTEALDVVAQKMLSIWKAVLNQKTLAVDDRFLEAGGNSLKATALAMAVWQEFEVALPFTEILGGNVTVRTLADEIKGARQSRYQAIPVVPQAARYALSSAQRRLFYLWHADPTSLAYNVPVAFQLDGTLDIERLRDSVGKLIARHSCLRMSFHLHGGLQEEPYFVVHGTVTFDVRVTDRQAEVTGDMLRSCIVPFDLAAAPLFRCRLFVLPGKRSYLFMDFHHIVVDGVSIVNLLEDLFGFYNGNDPLSLAIQFKDIVGWERVVLSAEEMLRQETFWMKRYETGVPKLALPTDFVRPAVFDTRGEKFAFYLSPETISVLRAIAASNGCTLYAVFFTFYSVLLSKYAGQDDVVIGIPVSGRKHPDQAKMVGMFVNNLAIRCEIAGEERFTEVLSKTWANLKASFQHQDYPFERLVNRVEGRRDISRNPVFDTMLVYHTIDVSTIKGGDVLLTPCFFDPGFAKFDISLEIFESADSVRCFLEYASSLFKRETMENFAGYFKNLIACVEADPAVRVADMLLMDNKALEEAVITFNATEADYPGDTKVHRLFEEQVMAKPDQIALTYAGNHYTYQQLDDHANALAAQLEDKGVGPGAVVAIVLPRSPEFIVTTLAVLKRDACFVPVDVSLPEQRIQRLLDLSGCRLAIAAEMPAEGFNGMAAHTTFKNLHLIDFGSRGEPAQVAAQGPADALAYIIFTSGTTGEPKGVMIAHRSLVNYLWWAKDIYIQQAEDTFCLLTSVSFDLTLTSIFLPLITGHRLIIYGEAGTDVVIDQLLDDDDVHIVKVTPSHLKLIKDSVALRPDFKSAIKTFIIGGEELESAVAADIYHLFKGELDIFNEYGPTETTIGCMIHKFDPRANERSVPIGVPIHNTQIYVLDKFLKPVPHALPGELYVSGDGMFKGYLHNAALTSEKCVASPFVKGKLLYRTGDIAKRLVDGTIVYLGRSDNQVKINGYRIEPGEIEYHMLALEGVKAACVVTKQRESGPPFLCAYYTGDGIIEEGMLRDYLVSRIPYYMIPHYFVRVASFPLTIGGKIDFEKLPLPGSDYGTGKRRAMAPRNPLEAEMLAVWREIFNTATLTTADNFYEMGGDSIKATQIASRLNARGIAVRVKDILTYHTIEQVCLHAGVAANGKQYEQGVVAGRIPMTPILRWFFSQQFTNPNYFNQTLLLDLNGVVDIAMLTQAFEKIIAHHDALRINYDAVNDVLFYNAKHLASPFTIPVYSLKDTGQAEVSALCRSIQSSFDIGNGLLMKAAFIANAGKFGKLMITVHHFLIDGVSWRILLSDLVEVYQAIDLHTEFKFPDKTASFLYWSEALIDYSKTEAAKAEGAFWAEMENPDFALPLDFETADWRSAHAAKISGYVGERETGLLLSAAHGVYGTDISILLTAALLSTLKTWTGKDDVTIELENHGRHLSNVDTSRTIGWFTTMYPVRFNHRADGIEAHVGMVRDRMKAIPNNGIGYGVYKYLNPETLAHRAALTEVRFNYLGQFGKELNNALFSLKEIPNDGAIDAQNMLTAKMELTAMVIDKQLFLEITYNSQAHRQETAQNVYDDFLYNLTRILVHIESVHGADLMPEGWDAVALDAKEMDALFE